MKLKSIKILEGKDIREETFTLNVYSGSNP